MQAAFFVQGVRQMYLLSSAALDTVFLASSLVMIGGVWYNKMKTVEGSSKF